MKKLRGWRAFWFWANIVTGLGNLAVAVALDSPSNYPYVLLGIVVAVFIYNVE